MVSFTLVGLMERSVLACFWAHSLPKRLWVGAGVGLGHSPLRLKGRIDFGLLASDSNEG